MWSSTFFHESRDRMVTLLLPAEKCFQLLGDDLIEHGRFRMARNVLEADVEHRLWCATACAVLHLVASTTCGRGTIEKSGWSATTRLGLSSFCRLPSAPNTDRVEPKVLFGIHTA